MLNRRRRHVSRIPVGPIRQVVVSVLLGALVLSGCSPADGEEGKVELKFSGGYETDPIDKGRPVVLIAAALKVKSEEFRKAFSGVTPAQGRGPTDAEARKNKEALMKVLAPLGVTNERLDEVSNYYRYRPQNGELWKHTPAKGHAVVEGGVVRKIVIDDPGSGYSSKPKVVIPGHERVVLRVTIRYDQDLKKNGSVESIEIDKPAGKGEQEK